ncbi:O-antigen ligase family protein [Mycobacterium marinum]|uniref:O-antigen ligase family protein n=1 Tax=Mycobacterium marinum TaxID=1781 RepID=UPI0023590F10|nr:O-antigen ligase family protein [Mycobacterium marinum]MDC8981632.1 O-antigen ligase family protein [Mycobacterium marinum]MDC8998653.1 O-antigen ligase family protein [Mycobacterium marinum]MDC9009021.1 O-antigen ligase family protein [Mycobacterium marinum]
MILYLPRRYRLAMGAALLAAFLFGCFVFGVLSVRHTGQGVMLIAGMFSLVVYWAKPEAMVGIALFLAFAALPASLHVGKVVGPGVIYAYQVALVLAICYLIPLVRPRVSDFVLPGIFAVAVLLYAVVGLVLGHPDWVVMRSAQNLLEMAGGFVLALLVVYGNYLRMAIVTMVVTLWFSAGMAIVGSVHAIRLAGRAESLAETTGADQALRIILSAQTPATAVLSALVAAVIVGRVRPAFFFALGLPALIIVLLAFARHVLISLAVAAVVALLATFSWPALRRTATLFLVGTAVVAFVVPTSLFLLQQSRAGAWLADQFTAFNQRVLHGLSGGALAVDESTQDRLREIDSLDRAIAEAPVFGHGLGYAYQQPYGDDPDDFTMKLYPTFSHNFYLWWLAKAGAVGMALFAMFALPPLFGALRRGSDRAKIAAATSIGLLAISAVWPLPEMPVDALGLGLVLGLTMGFATQRRSGADAQAADTDAALAPAGTPE